jgi:uncharacterized protein with PIN domain
MLQGVGRWLRIAGYDTAIAETGSLDAELLAVAAAEARVLLTCDRALGAQAAGALVLGSERLDEAAGALRRRLGIDWLRAPFSRCLLDNAELRPADAQALARVPGSAQHEGETVTVCPECARVYWPGSHVRRMRARLERWQAL